MAWMFITGNEPDSAFVYGMAIFVIVINAAYLLYFLSRRGAESLFDTLITFVSLPIIMLAIYFDTNPSESSYRYVLASLLLALPFGLLIRRDVRLYKRKESLKTAVQTWPTTTGKIISSTVERDPAGSYVTPRIVYEYQVDGLTYQADLISLEEAYKSVSARSLASWQKTHNLVESYPEGTTVTIYYNPENIEQSFLRIDALD